MNTDELIDSIIILALFEDGRDITSEAIFSADTYMRGLIRTKAVGVLAGIDIAKKVFHKVSPQIQGDFYLADGSCTQPGDTVADIRGPVPAILKAERVVLNFMQRMSGIATATARYVAEVKDTSARIIDTRKTVPGHRVLDKLAVRIGGGYNHRMGLYDMALIKDNHIDAAGSIGKAVEKVRQAHPNLPIEVEARTLLDVEELLALEVDRIMLDNFAINEIEKAVRIVGGKIPLEASGGITLATVREVALTGVDYISVGEITHSVKALDISMTVKENA
ncbi:MAG: carboxylating nicotinate-nucleotide diphosphorylase [Deltaproteobacteria bacterium]|nr:carboxylating nicotinate-nucleotide diphosphorylase [Deltaproteobacteria bacterium]